MGTKPWVLITGATSGIGLSTAVLLAIEGYQVIASGRSDEKLEVLQTAADKADVTIRRVICDVSDEASVLHMKTEVLALTNGHGVDVLINNAGYAEGGALEEIPIERIKRQFDTNVIGLLSVIQAFVPYMRQRKSGKVINVSSVVGKISIPFLGAYTATKHAVEAISDALRVELEDAGIHVVTIAPGSIQTNFGTTVSRTIRDWANPDSPHTGSYKRFMSSRERESGASPMLIAKVISTALAAARPRPRYAAPFESKLVPILKAVLPTRVMDAILKRVIF